MTPTNDDPTPLTGVLVPIRSFDDAKSRLDGVLTRPERIDLVRMLAERVVDAARGLPVWVVSEDPAVATWAVCRGAVPMAVARSGLDESVTAALKVLRRRGLDRVIVAHGDLALADDLTTVNGPGVTIAPDRHRDGSNVMCIPTDADFQFAYGPGSFDRHRAEAERLGLPIRVVEDPTLEVDIDDPDDLQFVGNQGKIE